MARSTPRKFHRPLKVCLLATALAATLAANARQHADSAPELVVGRAPAVTVGVANTSVPGKAPATGHVLRATAAPVDPDGDTITGVTYRWLRGDAEIGSQSDYATTAADAGQTLRVEATATTDPAITTPTRGEGSTTVAIGANSAPTATVTIAGSATVGGTLTGEVDYDDVDGDPEGTHAYQWYLADNAAGTTNRTKIDGATSKDYEVQSSDQGKYLVFEVTPKSLTGTPNTGTPASAVSPRVDVAGTAPTATEVAIAGNERVGATLSGDFHYDDVDGDPPGTHAYQWYRADDAGGTVNRTQINGATSRDYTVTSADQGKHLVFEVTPKSLTGTPNTGTPASVVAADSVTGTAPTAAAVKFSRDPVVASVISASYAYDDVDLDPEGTSTFQWYRADDAAGTNKVEISGATFTVYTVQFADRGKHLVFEVTPKSSTGTPNTGTTVGGITETAVP